ncbi:MAG TPA: hypothetical protein VFI68_01080 [Anaerolineales bacterium]|nr:hypothetical protein [Anaerolineales bacterium]
MEKFNVRFILIYFVLLFTGLAFSALGYRFHVTGFIVAGIVWILVTPFAVRSTVHGQVRKWSIILLLIGAIGGVAAGTIFGENIKPIVGWIGGTVIGGVGGWLLYSLLFDSILHLIFDAILPKVSTIILFIVFILGALWGASSLGPSIPRYFEVIGGSMLVGGIIGAFSGILLGTEIIKRQEEWQD